MSEPVVSLLIPAYNKRFFAEAFASALAQGYPALEILVSDDSTSGDIEGVVRATPDPRVRYWRNTPGRGFHGNFGHCFSEAKGRFIKFLNDDDVLHQDCVAAMVAAFAAGGPTVNLVTSRRKIINDQGQRMEDLPPTQPLASTDTRYAGIALGDHVLLRSANYIGEPSTVMFRRDGVALAGDTLFTLGGARFHCLADVCLWLRLLARGDAIWLAKPYSAFRVHEGQEQSTPLGETGCMTERVYLPIAARALGFLQDEETFRRCVRFGRGLVAQHLTKPGLPEEALAMCRAAIDRADQALT